MMTIYLDGHKLELEVECSSCEGEGTDWKNGKKRVCPVCLGARTVITGDGETLLEFIRKYY